MSRPSDLADSIIALLPRLRRFALSLTRHADDGDDLVQTTVERALSRLDNWQPGSRLDSWMFKVMQNAWIDQLRARKTRGPDVSDTELAELPGLDGRAAMDARLTLQATLQAAMELPEEQRAVIVLVIVEGLSYRETADILDVPIGTVMSRLSRARMALERRVSGEGSAPLSVVGR